MGISRLRLALAVGAVVAYSLINIFGLVLVGGGGGDDSWAQDRTMVIAYCTYPQELRPGEPVLGGEYMAKVIGPHIFPHLAVQIKTCLAVPEQLPKDVPATSPRGLELLGLSGVHVRFCGFGSTSLLAATYFQMPDQVELANFHPTSALPQFLLANITTPRLGVHYFVDRLTRKPVGPLLTRMCREPHMEEATGVPLQFDTKAQLQSMVSFTIEMPYAFESFGRSRWNGGDPSRVFERHYENYGLNNLPTVQSAVTRLDNTLPSISKEKRGFMTMINSNCARPIGSLFRGLLGYAVYSKLGKPVHNLGLCPRNPFGAVKAGITVKQRKELSEKFGSGSRGEGLSTSEIQAHYKFSICFENSNVDGYVSEKVVNPYVGGSIPVYWGGGRELGEIVNLKAIVHCDLPSNLTQYWTAELGRAGFGKLKDLDEIDRWEELVYSSLLPHFGPCLERIRYLDGNDTAYDEVRRESLGTTNKQGKLTGYWDVVRYGKQIRSVYDQLQYPVLL
ncbi:hypothetical protein BASA81_006796 [Batrachochytrium salamandrivorans]|nr:hypothetical protein BASA81_006796 [Batrachochytrium salamandrivorans]